MQEALAHGTQHIAPVLVTGGTGLVGAHVIRTLLQKGYKVRAIKRASSSISIFNEAFDDASIADKVEWVEGDVLDVNSLLDAMQGIAHVYHCAATVSFSPKDVEQMMLTNINGTANVVNMAMEAGVKKLCHVSSVAALGRNSIKNVLIDEETHWQPSKKNSNYALSKYGAEREVWRGTVEGLDAVIVNPAIIIGPGNWAGASGKLFSTVNKGLKYYTEGVNGYVYVGDVAKAMVALMESPIRNEAFLLNAENLSYKSLFDTIAEALQKPKPAIKAESWMSEVVWRLEAVRQFLSGAKPLITRETARTANQKYYYNGDKIAKTISFTYTPIKEAIAIAAGRFKALHS